MPGFGGIRTWPLFVYDQRLFSCNIDPTEPCKSYDIEDSNHIPQTHEIRGWPNLELRAFFLVEINSKIWMGAGLTNTGDLKSYKSAFMHANYSWTDGPTVPSSQRQQFIVVKLSETTVWMYDTHATNPMLTYLYDDNTEEFFDRAALPELPTGEMFYSSSAASIILKGEGQVVLVLAVTSAFIYNPHTNEWNTRSELIPNYMGDKHYLFSDLTRNR